MSGARALGGEHRLEDFCRRWRTPFILEYELTAFRALYAPELRRELERADAALARGVTPARLSRRGRARRVLGDVPGALADLTRALDLDPRLAEAHQWLGELALGRPEAEGALTRALELDPRLPWARYYRGAGRLLDGRPDAALADLRLFLRSRPRCVPALLLAGLATEKRGGRGAAAFYRRAAKLDPVCAAARLLEARASSGRARARACEAAMNADPTYALITLSRHRPPRTWNAYLEWLRRFALQEPERAGWYYRQEDLHYSPYQFQEYEDSSRLMKEFPRAAWAAALVGRGVLRCPPDAGRNAVGLRSVNRAAALSPASGWIRAWRALAWIKAGEPRRALADLDDCLRRQPYYYRAYAWRGALRRGLGQAAGAAEDLDRAVAADEQYPFAWHERSLARRALGDFLGAAHDLDRAFSLDFRYSWVFAVGREPAEADLARAAAELDLAVARHPASASLRTWRGALRVQRKDFPGAFRDLENAARLDPHHGLAPAWHGWALLRDGRPDAAAEKLEAAARLEPELWILQGWLAEAEFLSGRRRRAFARLARVLRAKPKTWWVYHARARFHLQAGSPARAAADVAEAMAYEGRHADGYYLEAQAKLGLDDLAGAARALERTLTISPNMGRAYVLRAQVRERQGRPEEALADYRVVVEKFPYLFNADELRRAREALAA